MEDYMMLGLIALLLLATIPMYKGIGNWLDDVHIKEDARNRIPINEMNPSQHTNKKVNYPTPENPFFENENIEKLAKEAYSNHFELYCKYLDRRGLDFVENSWPYGGIVTACIEQGYDIIVMYQDTFHKDGFSMWVYYYRDENGKLMPVHEEATQLFSSMDLVISTWDHPELSGDIRYTSIDRPPLQDLYNEDEFESNYSQGIFDRYEDLWEVDDADIMTDSLDTQSNQISPIEDQFFNMADESDDKIGNGSGILLNSGDTIFYKKFGEGVVIEISDTGIATINFYDVGIKKIAPRYAFESGNLYIKQNAENMP